MTLKQPSQSSFPSGQANCQSCSTAGSLQSCGWLHHTLQHMNPSSSLKYLGSQFNLKGWLRLAPFTHSVQMFHAEIAGSASFLPHFGQVCHHIHATLLLTVGSALVLCVSNFPHSICLSCLFKDDTRHAGVAVSSEQLV